MKKPSVTDCFRPDQQASRWVSYLAATCSLAVASTTCIAAEGSIHLISGAGVPVCEAYLAAAKKWEYAAVRCLGDLPLDGARISRVMGPVDKREFSQDDDDSTLSLRQNVMTFVMAHDVNLSSHYITAKLGEWRGSEEQSNYSRLAIRNLTDIYYLEPVVRTITIDIDNDRVADTLFFYPHCNSGTENDTSTMSSPVILQADRVHVDTGRTIRLLRAPIKYVTNEYPRSRGDGSFVAIADIYKDSAYGLFMFDRKTYFDFWWDTQEGTAPDVKDDLVLRVILPSPKGAKAVCAFRVDPIPRR